MRQASDATKLRSARARINSLNAYNNALSSELRERRRLGEMLSNIAYNLAHRDQIEPELKAVLEECRKGWEAIRKISL